MSSIVLTDGLIVAKRERRLAIDRHRVAWWLDHFIFAALLGLIVIAPIPYGTVEPWWIALYECAAFGLGMLWMIEGVLTGSWQPIQLRLLAPLGVLIVFIGLQTVSWPGMNTIPSADPFETRLVALKLLALTINGALLVRYTSSAKRLRYLIYAVIGIAVISAAFGIARSTMQQSEAGFGLAYLRRGSGFAQFVNKNHFALLMEMSLGLIAGLVVGRAIKRQHVFLYVSIGLLLWVALVMTISRGAIFTMLAQIVFLSGCWIYFRRSRREERPRLRSIALISVLTICVVTAVAIAAVWVGGDVLTTRLSSLPAEVSKEDVADVAGVRRRELWSATWNLFKAQPLMGSGFGAYAVAITRFHNGSGEWIPEAAHNDYLELVASGGIIGSLLAGWLGLNLIRQSRRQLFARDVARRAACLGALTGILGIAIHSFVDFGLHVTANAVVFVALLVIATRDVDANDGRRAFVAD